MLVWKIVLRTSYLSLDDHSFLYYTIYLLSWITSAYLYIIHTIHVITKRFYLWYTHYSTLFFSVFLAVSSFLLSFCVCLLLWYVPCLFNLFFDCVLILSNMSFVMVLSNQWNALLLSSIVWIYFFHWYEFCYMVTWICGLLFLFGFVMPKGGEKWMFKTFVLTLTKLLC